MQLNHSQTELQILVDYLSIESSNALVNFETEVVFSTHGTRASHQVSSKLLHDKLILRP